MKQPSMRLPRPLFSSLTNERVAPRFGPHTFQPQRVRLNGAHETQKGLKFSSFLRDGAQQRKTPHSTALCVIFTDRRGPIPPPSFPSPPLLFGTAEQLVLAGQGTNAYDRQPLGDGLCSARLLHHAREHCAVPRVRRVRRTYDEETPKHGLPSDGQ